MKVLVLGAGGFVGAHVAVALTRAGHVVVAGARRPEEARRRAPGNVWVDADFARLLDPAAWTPLLTGVDAVVNCVGVLQDGGGDSTEIAHVAGPCALIAACEAAGVRRLVHVSAVGADEAAGTAYARSKRRTEELLEASALDWAVLRPSLIVARAVYGGTGLVRGLAGLPFAVPVLNGEQTFRPVVMDDLCAAILSLLRPAAPSRVALDVAGPQAVSLAELLTAYRAWLGLRPTPVLRVPAPLAWATLKGGDLLGRLGWPSALRSTAARQMAHEVAGDPDRWTALLGVAPRPFHAWLGDEPATVQDRWHARLYFVRPLAIAVLALFWTLSGLIALGPGRDAAEAVLRDGGFRDLSPAINLAGAATDVALGLLLLNRRWTARAALGMVLVTGGYLLTGTLALPELWVDPLGPWLKTLPAAALALFVAATDDCR